MNKKVFLVSALAVVSCFTQSCRETVRETEVREIEVEKSTEPEDNPGIFERTGDKIDNTINEEIDEEIDKIGDDN